MSITNAIGNTLGVSTPVTPAAAPAPAGKEHQVKAAVSSPVAASRVNPPVDHANISATSGLFTAALNGSDVRLDKIRPIQIAIANGTYSVPSSDVAGKLISSLIK